MIRSCIGAVLISILVAACGNPGGTPATSALAGGTETEPGGSSSPIEGIAAASCASHTDYSSRPDGTRVDDHANGFAITLPQGWAQIDLSSLDVVPAFSALIMKPGTAALVRTIGTHVQNDGYEWMAVDLAASAGRSQSPAPAELLIDLSPAKGATLDTIGAGLTADLRANGVTGDIEQIRLRLAGGDALGIRLLDSTQTPGGQTIQAVETYYIALRGGTQYSLVFSVAAENASGSTAIFTAMAQTFEFLSGCSASTP